MVRYNNFLDSCACFVARSKSNFKDMKRKYKVLVVCLSFVILSLIFVPRLKQGKINYDLFTAARQGNATVTKSLLAAGADVNARYPGDDFGWVKAAIFGNKYSSKATPLIIAASRDHVKVVQLLLDNGADTELRDSENYTALMWVEELRYESDDYEQIIKLLKQHGPNSPLTKR